MPGRHTPWEMAWRAVCSFVGSSLDLGMGCLEGRGTISWVVAEGAIVARVEDYTSIKGMELPE